MTSPVLEAALDYAARGWHAIPLHHPTRFGEKTGPDRAECSCSNPRCESQGKHPLTRNGSKEASSDRSVVAAWWDRWPNANVGLLTGGAFDVCDIDGDDGVDALDVVADGGDALIGPMVTTGRGVHVYVTVTGAGNRAGVVSCVDWRGRNGYVVAPPSVHYSGKRYLWTEGFGPDHPLVAPPDWLRARIVAEPTSPLRLVPNLRDGRPPARDHGALAERRIDGACGRVAMAREGQRNACLNWAAHALGRGVVEDGLDLRDVVSGLLTAAARCGLGERETAETIKSGLRSVGIRWSA